MKLTFVICAFLLANALPVNAADQAVKPKAAPEELFKKWDANGDGKLTKAEFMAAPIAKRHPDTIELRWQAISNGKGEVTLEEYKAAIAASAPPPAAQAAERPADAREMVDCINPMIGAIASSDNGGQGFGKTFPGAATPFGMIQLSPDTITGAGNGPGYSYHHETIEGFSFTHMSGIGWHGDLGNFQVMPATGPRLLDRDQAKSAYSHDREQASAAYYSVDLQRYGIKAELTAAPRAGMIRFTYPESAVSRIQIDLGRRIGQKERWLSHSLQSVRVVDDHTIEGFMRCSSEDGGWGRGKGNVNFTQYFCAVFSKPIEKFGVWDKEHVFEGLRAYEGTNMGFFLEFSTKKDEPVLLRAGFSYVSGEGARANLAHDIPDWDFDGVHQRSRGLWVDALKGVACEGGSGADREVFATALYHCMIDPRSVSDVDGQYLGADGKAHRTDKFIYRSIFSGWDVFRSQFPLLSIIRPDVVNDEINSLLQLASLSQRNYLERWELLNAYSGCMLGNPAVSVIVDAYEKGIRGYDAEEAYRQCKNTVEKFGNGPGGFTPGSMSKTLEYAYSDWCLGRFAESLGKSADEVKYYARSKAYTNIWNADVKWMRARLENEKDGSAVWLPWKGKTVYLQGTTESNPYQQGWFVPQDVYGLIGLMGEDYFVQELNTFFDKTPADFLWNDYYNHPNEPCHHVAYLFNYVGRPWLTQKWTRTICQKAYGTGVRGLCGNEDVGQMSAWYLLSAMGLHPVCPGDGIYLLTSPVFDQVSLRLDPNYYPGRSFTVRARGNSPANLYIQSATLNGQPLNRAWVTHAEVVAGGTLEFTMGPKPNMKWASAPENRPPSFGRSVIQQTKTAKPAFQF
ncbi:MAG: GH92 family glycosyl hydrolase [Verrucomicrobiota bacterium]